MTIIPIILSGGGGARLWPFPWGNYPKQFLPLFSDKTMIQETLLRLKGIDTKLPIVSCGEGHRFLVAQQIGEILDERPSIILEPVAKNTAPALAAACCEAMHRNSDSIVIVLPSDHVIADVPGFQKAVLTAVKQAEQGYLVIFGIVPTFPATGYGYVKASDNESDGAYILEKFIEKPCLEKAQKYFASGEYFWNSGMFVFKASVFLDELKKYNPDMAELSICAYERANKADSDFIRLDAEFFGKIKGNSIDYAVMEKTKIGKIVKLDAGWDDVGSWSALYDISEKDENENVIKGDVLALNTKNSYILGRKRTIATIGLEDVVIVEAEDSLLIAKMDQIQDVKKVAEEIKKREKSL